MKGALGNRDALEMATTYRDRGKLTVALISQNRERRDYEVLQLVNGSNRAIWGMATRKCCCVDFPNEACTQTSPTPAATRRTPLEGLQNMEIEIGYLQESLF